MDLRQKILYHQIHPLKLLTDWSTGLVSAYLLWQHRLELGLVVGFVPAVLVSAALLTWVDLERYAESSFGHYIQRYMTWAMEGLRLVGAIILWIAAWFHSWLGMSAGFLVVVVAWLRGKIWP